MSFSIPYHVFRDRVKSLNTPNFSAYISEIV